MATIRVMRHCRLWPHIVHIHWSYEGHSNIKWSGKFLTLWSQRVENEWKAHALASEAGESGRPAAVRAATRPKAILQRSSRSHTLSKTPADTLGTDKTPPHPLTPTTTKLIYITKLFRDFYRVGTCGVLWNFLNVRKLELVCAGMQ